MDFPNTIRLILDVGVIVIGLTITYMKLTSKIDALSKDLEQTRIEVNRKLQDETKELWEAVMQHQGASMPHASCGTHLQRTASLEGTVKKVETDATEANKNFVRVESLAFLERRLDSIEKILMEYLVKPRNNSNITPTAK